MKFFTPFSRAENLILALTWRTHIDNVSSKVSKSIGLLFKIRLFVNSRLLKILYYSLVYPYLIYAVEVWGSADNTHLNKILILQKRIVRLMTFSEKKLNDYSLVPSDPLFIKTEILKVHDIFKIKVAKFIYNSLNKMNPVNFHSWFTLTTEISKFCINKDLIRANRTHIALWSKIIKGTGTKNLEQVATPTKKPLFLEYFY